MLQGSFKGVSLKFQGRGSFKDSRCFQKVLCCMALIAASRAEGGLVIGEMKRGQVTSIWPTNNKKKHRESVSVCGRFKLNELIREGLKQALLLLGKLRQLPYLKMPATIWP